jgi:hypothetical protein
MMTVHELKLELDRLEFEGFGHYTVVYPDDSDHPIKISELNCRASLNPDGDSSIYIYLE